VIRRFAAVVLVLGILGACSTDEAQPLTISDITVFAPLPGQPAGVAYFSLQNTTPTAVTLQRVNSPHFVSVEIHTTLEEAGIAQMLAVDALTIAEHSDIEFAPGGPHLMLMGPLDDLETGDMVTLEFFYTTEGNDGTDTEGQLSLRAPVVAR
jgi:periplasmic copper chaperone A